MNNDCASDMTRYYRCQTNICYQSQLFGEQKGDHSSKVLMLFAEIYSFLAHEYDLNIVPNLIINFGNTPKFKKWFWNIKHRLGEELQADPNYHDIGTWIGKGFFFKILINILLDNNRKMDQINFYQPVLMKKIVQRQNVLLQQLLKEKQHCPYQKIGLEMIRDGYILLNEKIILNEKNEYFFSSNLIY
ncbi:MAG: hypothetical protein MJB14_23525 [Spirochaetes bacterium]|nr:hypothetical protein [Spirochaetota bacterium]